jgi:hypothetical protein
VQRTAALVAKLSRASHPEEHAATLVAAFLPDLLRYRPGQSAHFAPGTGNGRGLHDDAFGTTLSLLVGQQLGATTSPNPVVPGFPHLAPAGYEDMPPLADLLGLREHPPATADWLTLTDTVHLGRPSYPEPDRHVTGGRAGRTGG